MHVNLQESRTIIAFLDIEKPNASEHYMFKKDKRTSFSKKLTKIKV